MTGRSKVRIFESRSRLRRVDAASVRSRHAPYTRPRRRPRFAPNGVITREHDNAIQNTPPSTHYTVACALLYSGYPHVRPQSYHPQTYIAYAQTPSPPRAAAAILIIPPHARSYTIVDGIIVGITIVIILSHASSSCLPCIPRLATCPNIPTRSPPPPVPCK